MERTGSWRDINSGGPTTPITRRYLTLWQDHGINPTNAAYHYLMIPKATVARTAELYEHRDVTFLNNNNKIQAVRQSATGITMANFWDPAGGATGGVIEVNWLSSVIVQEHDGLLKIGVAEPYRSGNTIRVRITPSLTGYRLLSKDSAVTVVSTGSSIMLDVRPGTFGGTRYATFTRR